MCNMATKSVPSYQQKAIILSEEVFSFSSERKFAERFAINKPTSARARDRERKSSIAVPLCENKVIYWKIIILDLAEVFVVMKRFGIAFLLLLSKKIRWTYK